MAKIESGILSSARGECSGVQFQVINGAAFVREKSAKKRKVTPGNEEYKIWLSRMLGVFAKQRISFGSDITCPIVANWRNKTKWAKFCRMELAQNHTDFPQGVLGELADSSVSKIGLLTDDGALFARVWTGNDVYKYLTLIRACHFIRTDGKRECNVGYVTADKHGCFPVWEAAPFCAKLYSQAIMVFARSLSELENGKYLFTLCMPYVGRGVLVDNFGVRHGFGTWGGAQAV